MRSFFLLLTFVAQISLAATSGSLFTYEGVITDANQVPITTPVSVQLQIIYSTNCIVYEETQTITPGSFGEFSAMVGTGTRTDTTNNTIDRIFASSGTVACNGSSAVSVTGFTTRSLRIQVNGVALTPDVTIGNIPVAINAMKLADRDASEFLLRAVLPTCAAGTYLSWDGTQFQCASVSGANGGTVTSVTATAPLSVTSSTSNPIISMPAANASISGYISNSDWSSFNSKQAAGNYITSLSGDLNATGPGASSATILRIQGTNISGTPTTVGQVMRYTGSSWTPNFVSMFDLRSSITGTQAFGGVGCTAGQTLTWTAATDNLSCTDIQISASQVTGAITNGGNSFSATATIGTNDANSLVLKTNNNAAITIDPVGKVSITSSSGSQVSLHVSGSIRAGSYDNGSSPFIDWSRGNSQVTTAGCTGTSYIFSNMIDGGVYTLAITGTFVAACIFSQSSPDVLIGTAGSGSFYFLPANETPDGINALFVFTRVGAKVFVTWASGFSN